MKVLAKVLIISALSLPLGASAITYAIVSKNNAKAVPTDIYTDGEYYTMEGNGFTFNINRENLRFTVEKNGKIWDSGTIDEHDMKITGLREAFLQSAATLYYCNSTAGESYFSIFDEYHVDSTRTKFKVDGDTLKVNVSAVEGRRTKPTFKIDFTINYELAEDGLRIYVTDIVEDPENINLLSKLVIYPGFSMSYKLNDGYFLIPDGSGALIDLSKPTHAQNELSLLTYGQDIGIVPSTRTYYSGEQLSMPMYAIADEEKAMMTTVEGGQEFSELNAKVAGMTDDYNAAYFRFLYRQTTYQYLGVSDSNKKPVPQSEANVFTPVLHYHLYDQKMEYYDIASKYRDYLLTNGLLEDKQYGDSNVKLEFLMSENKKALFGNETIKMTTTKFIKDKVGELLETGHDFTISLKGYTQGGFGGSYPNTFPIEGLTGSGNDYKNLGTYLKDNGINVNYNVDTVRSFKSMNNKTALNMSQKQITSSDYVTGTDKTFYRLTPNNTTSLINKYESYLDKYSASGFDFTSLGYELFSTYYHEKNSRTESIKKYQDAMNSFSHLTNMRKPNLYMFKYFDNYLDAPTSSSKYMIETESVPFLQMVLSGYKSFYSSPINLNYLGDKQLLEMVDYNVNPSYLLTQEDTMKLIDSPSSSYIYSSVYEVWKEDIINSYNKVISVLKQVEGHKYLSRTQLANKVYGSIYDNDKIIIVNYSDSNYEYDGHTVLPLSSGVFDL